MKNLILTIILATITLSCSKNDNETQNNIPTELIGKWKIIEVYTTEGGLNDGAWSSYDSGHEYDTWFKNDGTFLLTNPSTNPDCMGGNYSILENNITYSNNPCSIDQPVTIELINEINLIINLNHFEIYKTKYQKITE